jgi:ActR/RegA family two-component response regulator
VVVSPVEPLRCLIVDDSQDFLVAVTRYLERDGFTVVGVASTIAEAQRSVEALCPDVTLVDVYLGSESGFDLETSAAVGFLPKLALSPSAIRELLAAQERDPRPNRR